MSNDRSRPFMSSIIIYNGSTESEELEHNRKNIQMSKTFLVFLYSKNEEWLLFILLSSLVLLL